MTTTTTTTGMRTPHSTTHHGAHKLTATASILSRTPMPRAHPAVPPVPRDRSDPAAYDVLTAGRPDLPARTRLEQHGGMAPIDHHPQRTYLSPLRHAWLEEPDHAQHVEPADRDNATVLPPTPKASTSTGGYGAGTAAPPPQAITALEDPRARQEGAR